MSAAVTVAAAEPAAPGQPSSGPNASGLSRDWLVLGFGIALLYVPTVVELFQTTWTSDAQGHGPIVLGLAIWLAWKRWPDRSTTPASESRASPWAWLLIGLATVLYALGRSQGILVFEAGSAVPMLTGCVLLLIGWPGLRALWFPLFFLCFCVPLPPVVVDTLTQPMKLWVSFVAEWILNAAGLPIARSGVILQVGPYQLLVADACAGLQTLFSLEAMGLLYLNVVHHSSMLRNVVLAALIVPISFIANVTRVIVLILITYFFGDEAGQGFLHGFAGMVLFLTSLLLIVATDTALRRVTQPPQQAAGTPS